MNKDFPQIGKEKFPPIELADEIKNLGGNGRFGQINLIDKGGNIVVSIKSGIGGEVIAGTYTGAALEIMNSEGKEILSLRDDGKIYIGGNGVRGELYLANSGNRKTNILDGNGNIYAGGDGTRGDIYARDSNGNDIIHLSGEGIVSIGGNGTWGQLALKDTAGTATSRIDGGGRIFAGCKGYNGQIFVYDKDFNQRILLDGSDGDIKLSGANKPLPVITIGSSGKIEIGGNGTWGQLALKDTVGTVTSRIDGGGRIFAGCKGYNGQIFVYDKDFNQRILLDGSDGDIKLSGADCAEEFDVIENGEICPGTVLVIQNDGKLCPSEMPYDRRVAGVVSGGEDYHPGIILDKNSNENNKRLPIALTGKTYCRVDAQHAPVELGDLLTTSSTLGHAMKAVDPLKAFGAVIGKSLASLKDGTGIIPILVALQ